MQTYNVTAGDTASLQNAFNQANDDGDDSTINVPAGHYTLDPAGGLSVTGDGTFTLVGAGARTTIIDGGGGAITPGDSGSTDQAVFTIFAGGKAPADATISGITVTGGNPDQNGGGFVVGGIGSQLATLHLYDSTVTGNQAEEEGGGIYNAGVLDVKRVTFSGNFAQADGAAIASITTAYAPARGVTEPTTSIENSTFTNNTSDSNSGGAGQGAIFNDAGAMKIVNSTIDHNADLDGSNELSSGGPSGGIAAVGGEVTVVNTIVSGNTAAPSPLTAATRGAEAASVRSGPVIASNCSVDAENSAAITSLGHNIETAADCGFTAAGDQQNTDPLLGVLGNNGGQMDTLALLAGSPAIDHADAAFAPATDEIGTTRPQGAAPDVGAYEVPVVPAVVTPVTPVVPPKPVAPKVGVLGVRRACVSRSFHIRFRIATAASVKRVVVKLDGRRIKTTTRSSFTLTINTKKLKAGRHRLTVSATDSAGQTTTSKRTFSVCKAAKPRRQTAPRFTG